MKPLGDSDLQRVVGRAADLEREARAKASPAVWSESDVRDVARELAIPDQFVTQALEENARRAPPDAPSNPHVAPLPPPQAAPHAPPAPEPSRAASGAPGTAVAAAMVALAAAFTAVVALAWRTPPPASPPVVHTVLVPQPLPPPVVVTVMQVAPPPPSGSAPAARGPAVEPSAVPPAAPTDGPPTDPLAEPPLSPEGPSAHADDRSVTEELDELSDQLDRDLGLPTPRLATPQVSYLDLRPLSAAEATALQARLVGSWRATAHSLFDRAAGVRVVSPVGPLVVGERGASWTFGPAGRYTHATRGAGPVFTGSFALTHQVTRAASLGLDASTQRYLLRNTDVRSSVGAWSTDHYLVELVSPKSLALYFLGRTVPAAPPVAQGSMYSRAP